MNEKSKQVCGYDEGCYPASVQPEEAVILAQGWAVYGSLPEERYQLMRKRGAARWWDRKVGCWIGPEQRNVGPAVAWALAFEEAPEGLREQIVGGIR